MWKSKHFKMENLHTVKSLLQKEDWMIKVDLKDAFFMVPKAKQFHHLLLFKANVESFQFLCLPFGLCRSTPVIKSSDDSLCMEDLSYFIIKLKVDNTPAYPTRLMV